MNRSSRTFRSRLTAILAIFVCAGPLQAQTADEMADARQAVQDAFAAREAGDLEGYRSRLERALELRPGHPELLYYLASAQALTGRADAAVAALGRVARMGLGLTADRDPDFEALAADPRFQDVLRRLADNRRPRGRARTAFTIPGEAGFLPEGLAYDPVSGAFYVGSVRKRKVLRVDSAGRVDVFVAPAFAGLWSVMGMVADPERRHLWVASAALPETEGVDEAEIGRSAVFQFDLDSGELVLHYHFPPGHPPRVLGDLVLASSGAVYASDARGSALYTIRPGGDFLEIFVQRGTFASPQGLAMASDEGALYVADYSKGIFRVDVNTREATRLSHPENETLLGIDGLVRAGDALVAVQNGTNPHRILRLHLDGAGQAITRVEVLASALPEWDEPTLGVMVGDRFYFVANSQWYRFAADEEPDEGVLQEPRIMWIGR